MMDNDFFHRPGDLSPQTEEKPKTGKKIENRRPEKDSDKDHFYRSGDLSPKTEEKPETGEKSEFRRVVRDSDKNHFHRSGDLSPQTEGTPETSEKIESRRSEKDSVKDQYFKGNDFDRKSISDNKSDKKRNAFLWIVAGSLAAVTVIILCVFYVPKLFSKDGEGVRVESTEIHQTTEQVCSASENDSQKNLEDGTEVLIKSDSSENIKAEIQLDEEVPPEDSDTFYREISQVISVQPASDSTAVYSEEQVVSLFRDRGFENNNLESAYSADGEFLSERDITSPGKEKHPTYDLFYTSTQNILWTISVVEDQITAYPVSYMMESQLGFDVIIAESEDIKAYAADTNQFYLIRPATAYTRIVLVRKLDRETLDKITKDDIDAYFR